MGEGNKNEDLQPWPEPRLVSATEIRSTVYDAITDEIYSASDYNLESAFLNATKKSFGVEPDFSVYRLLLGMCSIHLTVDDRASKFSPKAVFQDGSRTPIPEDYAGEQSDEVFKVLLEVSHPALQARLADVVWTNDKRKGQAAKIALEAYCECVDRLLSGSFKPSYDNDSAVSIEVIDLVERAAQLHSGSSKRNAAMHDRVAGLIIRLYEAAIASVDVTPLIQLSNMALRYKIIDAARLAEEVEAAAIAADTDERAYAIGNQRLYDIAAYAYGECGKMDDKQRCQIASAEQNLKMAPETGAASAAAYWYRQAIKAFKAIPGTGKRREELRKELSKLQEKSLDEVGSFSTPLDLGDLVDETLREFERVGLSEALMMIAKMAQPEGAQKIRADVLKTQYGLSAMFGSTHLDEQGKVIAEVGAAPWHGEEPSEDWIKSKIVEHLKIRIHISINARLEPARTYLASLTAFSERHFEAIVQSTPFIADSHKATFTLGFARLFQGDILSAGPLLIPQLEHCIRHVLLTCNLDTSKMRDDLIQEDRSLSAIYDLYRNELVRIFGESIVLYIELIFIHRPGPALRHEFAHGKIGDRSYFDQEIRFACYFIFYLACAPLFSRWEELIRPEIKR